MKRRTLIMLLSVLLLVTMGIAPLSASAASNVKILKVNVEGARLRTGPSTEYEVIKSLSKGSKVFYAGKMENSFAYVCTSKGTRGYMFKGYLDSYGACKWKQVYYCTKKSAAVYKKAKNGAKKVTTLSKGQHVIVYQVKGNWAYIKTLSGKGGYVKKSALKKA